MVEVAFENDNDTKLVTKLVAILGTNIVVFTNEQKKTLFCTPIV